MNFNVISIFPESFNALTNYGITSRAYQNKLYKLNIINPRRFVDNNYKSVDDKPYGGGAGTIMLYYPLAQSISLAKKNNPDTLVINLSPQGKKLDKLVIEQLKEHKSLTFICGRYQGIDQRVIDKYIDLEISIGDYVISGGELAAMIVMDSIIRTIPNAINNKQSLAEETFANHMLECPQYTKPAIIDNMKVPKVLLNGNHKKIYEWRKQQQIKKTKIQRPDLLK